MIIVKKLCLAFLFIASFYYIGEVVAFANTLQWHDDHHPLVLISDTDGEIDNANGIKIGDYYITNVSGHKLYLNPNLESKQECSICKGEKNQPLLIKIIWPLCGIHENKTLAKR
jgi:hypothetical protein